MVLKVQPTDFNHFLCAAFIEILSLENPTNDIDSSKKMKFLFKFYYLSKRNEAAGSCSIENGRSSSIFDKP